MAITLTRKDLSFDLSVTIDGAISAARAEKSIKTAKVESDFQKAIADGTMGYEAQLAFRRKQLSDEENSGLKDPSLVASLETSIGSTKKLIRYEKYRTKYYDNYAEMNAGRMSSKEQLNFIKSQIGVETDPDLKAEMQKELAAAEKEVKSYENTITTNLITRATNDKTEQTLNAAIVRVQEQRVNASLGGREDEVISYDSTLSALQSQLSKVNVSDSMNRMEINTNLKGATAVGKLDLLNGEINRANSVTPFFDNNKRYNSAQDFWTQTRDNYLSGSGAGIFQNFTNDLSKGYDEVIKGSNARDGIVNSTVLSSIQGDFSDLKSRAEVQPFLNKIANLESVVLGTALESTTKRIVDFTTATGGAKDFAKADTVLKDFMKKFGVDTTSSQLDLADKLRQISSNPESKDLPGLEFAAEKLTTENFPIPTITEPTIASPGVLPPDAKSNISANTSLRIGSEGAEVVKLQEKLGLNPDGIFGRKTDEAVKAFQTSNNLTIDGVFGSITAKKLNEINPAQTTPPPVVPPPVVPPLVVPPPVVTAPVAVPQSSIDSSGTALSPNATPMATSKKYKVLKGDTLATIAKNNNTTVDKITGYKSGDPNKIKIGETLTIT